MTDKKMCEKGFEMCRIRSSIQTIVYIPFFAFAVWSLLRVYSPSAFSNIFKFDTHNNELSEIVSFFYIAIYIPFLSILLIHLVRLYFSLLVIDEDPDFFYYNFKDLGVIKRGVEFVLRVGVLFTLLLFVKNTGIAPAITLFSYAWANTYFAPLLYLYTVLLLWDIMLMFFKGFSFKNSVGRGSFLINDLTGMGMSVIIVLLQLKIIPPKYITLLSGGMVILLLIAFGSLMFDLWKNIGKYIRHTFKFIPDYFCFSCSKGILFSSDCSVINKIKVLSSTADNKSVKG